MICPNCNKIILDNTHICPNCNAIVSNGTPIINNKKQNVDSQGRPRMIFNIIFAAWLMLAYGTTSASTVLSLFQATSAIEFLIPLVSIAISATVIYTGVSLILRKKFGFISQYIINGIGLLGNVALFALAMFIVFGFDIGVSEYDQVFDVLVDFFAWLFAIITLPGIGMHITGLIYYTKNKRKYFQTNENEGLEF